MYSGDSEVTEKKFGIIIAAAGSGKRMNMGVKKQYIELDGKEIYLHPVITAEKSPLIDEIIIVAPQEDIELIKEQCCSYNISKLKAVVPGGAERQDSIYEGLKNCSCRYVAIQDGARPFMREEYLEFSYEELRQNSCLNGVVIGVKAKDTVKIIDNMGFIVETPKRENLVMAQTPQTFETRYLKEIYERAREEKFLGTDDSSLVERYGGVVKVLAGDYENIKITTVEDLKIARSWRDEDKIGSV